MLLPTCVVVLFHGRVAIKQTNIGTTQVFDKTGQIIDVTKRRLMSQIIKIQMTLLPNSVKSVVTSCDLSVLESLDILQHDSTTQ